MRCPARRIRPDSGGRWPAMALNRVVLPAPFGPMRPVIEPLGTRRLTRSTARSAPKLRTTFSSSSTAEAPSSVLLLFYWCGLQPDRDVLHGPTWNSGRVEPGLRLGFVRHDAHLDPGHPEISLQPLERALHLERACQKRKLELRRPLACTQQHAQHVVQAGVVRGATDAVAEQQTANFRLQQPPRQDPVQIRGLSCFAG